jgi:hypothetical protein
MNIREIAATVLAEAAGHGSVAKLHIEDKPALAAGGLNDWRCGMRIGNSRDAISIDLPVTRQRAVGRQNLRLRLRSIEAALGARMNAAASVPRIGAHRRQTRHRVLGPPRRSARTSWPAQTRPPSAPTRLPLLRNGSISPTKGWKNSENGAHVRGKGTH